MRTTRKLFWRSRHAHDEVKFEKANTFNMSDLAVASSQRLAMLVVHHMHAWTEGCCRKERTEKCKFNKQCHARYGRYMYPAKTPRFAWLSVVHLLVIPFHAMLSLLALGTFVSVV